MSKKPNFDEFLALLSRVLDTPASEIENAELSELVNFDSLGRIEVAAAIEDDFGWQVPQENLSECSTARELFDLVIKNVD